MKKFYVWMLILLCPVMVMPVDAKEYITNGVCSIDFTVGKKLLYTIDTKGELAFWYDSIGQNYTDIYDESMPTGASPLYMNDFRGVNETVEEGSYIAALSTVPWADYLNQIRSVNLTNVSYIGRYALGDMPNLLYVLIPAEVKNIADYAFMGSTNLQAIEMMSENPFEISYSSLLIAMLETGEGIQVPTIIVPENCVNNYKGTSPWDNSTLIAHTGLVSQTHWTLMSDDSVRSNGLCLDIANWTEYAPFTQIPDREDNEPFPWDAIGDQITDLVVNENISYIGREAFASLTNLETILFNGYSHPLDSMHAAAFSPYASPWMFAFGTGDDDGPLVPPVVIGATADLIGQLADTWKANTVLYVPDAQLVVDDELVRCVDLYRNDPFWGAVFNRITDRTVAVEQQASGDVLLSWLPLENAQAYKLTIRMFDGTQWRDTSYTIPATGRQGLVDWGKIPFSTSDGMPARRARKDNDGQGGLTLTISITLGSGLSHNQDVGVCVSGMEPGMQYEFTRDVEQDGQTNARLSKGGLFTTSNEMALDHTWVTDTRLRVYDVMGRCLGGSLQDLPAGVYILVKGGERATIVWNR